MQRLEASGLEYRVNGGPPILSGIDCSFAKGELAVLTGPNGSGKTMLLRLLCGLLQPSQGKIQADGRGLSRALRASKDHIPLGLVFQDSLVQILGQTVEEDIRYGLDNLALSSTERDVRLGEALEWTGLAGKRGQDVRTLSGGERRRLCIAAVLALRPDFIFMDEPFSNLDYGGIREVLQIINNLKTAGTGLLIVTHELEKILAHADRLILLKEGRLIADALPERVLPYLEAHGVRKPAMKLADMTWLT